MVAILEKGEHNIDFHPMVDFNEASPLRNLKLKDEEGINSLPDTELFENLTLMGYNISPNQKFTFQKGQFSHQWKYLIHTIIQCISPKSTGFKEFSSNITTALICLATNRTYNFSKIIFDGLVKNVNNKISKFLMYPRFLTMCLRMTQFGQMTHTQKYVGEGSGTPIEPHYTPSPEAQSPSHTTHTLLTLPPITTTSLPTVTPTETTPIKQYTPRARIAQSSILPTVADEPASPLLKERVKMLEDRERVAATRSRDDAPIKGRSIDEGEACTERISDDSEEMATVLTFMDASIVLASGVVDVLTGSGSIPTAITLAEEQVPTGSDVVPTAKSSRADRCLGFQRVRSATRERGSEKEYHQFASELPMERRIELITDLVKYQDNYAKIYKYQSQQIKSMSKKQKRDYYMAVIRNNLGWKVKDFIDTTFEEVEVKFNLVWKQMEDFIPMGSKEEAESIKRKGLNLEQESAKKQKTSEEGRLESTMAIGEGDSQQQTTYKGEGLPSKEGSSTCDDQLQALSEELLTDGKRFDLEDIQDFKLSKTARKTASEERCHCQKKSEATARKIALLSKVKKKLSVKVK
nr:glutamic acid-rich protein-like [Tanacetum cinerariifolium]